MSSEASHSPIKMVTSTIPGSTDSFERNPETLTSNTSSSGNENQDLPGITSIDNSKPDEFPCAQDTHPEGIG